MKNLNSLVAEWRTRDWFLASWLTTRDWSIYYRGSLWGYNPREVPENNDSDTLGRVAAFYVQRLAVEHLCNPMLYKLIDYSDVAVAYYLCKNAHT